MPSEFRQFTDEQLAAMELAEAENELSNRVYKAAIFFEHLEGQNKVWGNGHHMAQNIAELAVNILKGRWIKPREKQTITKNETGTIESVLGDMS